MNNLVSIIMPSYNTGKYIAEAIQSVINQTYKYWELIIVDDCSSDNTDEIVTSFSEPRIKFFKNKINSGAAVSRNRALRECLARYIRLSWCAHLLLSFVELQARYLVVYLQTNHH